jgi:hypothetical protein
MNTAIVPIRGSAAHYGDLDHKKHEFLKHLASVSNGATALRQIVTDLLRSGVHWKQLVSWATDAGYTDHYARCVLSKILCDCGIRRRKSGAGPKVPQEALAIAAWARDSYPTEATKFLRAAWRASKRRDEASETELQTGILSLH